MKSASFSYERPRTVAAVLAALQSYGDEARLLAGGQTLLATLNMRLSEPSVLIDLQSVEALRGITITVTSSALRIGAMVTHSEIESSALIKTHAPILAMAAPHIAHRAIRNRGTFGGSIAYGDPAAEWPACLLALDGVVVAQSLRGERRIDAADFFTGLYTTALAADEIITACELPVANRQHQFAFTELARRHGDYAVVGLAATAQTRGGVLGSVRLAWLGVGHKPMRTTGCEALLDSRLLKPDVIDEAVQALKEEMTPVADLTHSEATKRQLASVLLKRTLLNWMNGK